MHGHPPDPIRRSGNRSDRESAPPQLHEDVVELGELPGPLLGVDQIAVHMDLEHAASARDELDLGGGDLTLDEGGQTGRPRLVASGRAVFDRDVHAVPSRSGIHRQSHGQRPKNLSSRARRYASSKDSPWRRKRWMSRRRWTSPSDHQRGSSPPRCTSGLTHPAAAQAFTVARSSPSTRRRTSSVRIPRLG